MNFRGTMRIGIRAQLIGYTLATALLVGGATIAYSIHKQRTAIHHELKTRARTMASSLANALVDPFYEADINRLSLQLELAQRDPDVLAASARDEFGTEIAWGAGERDRSVAEPELDLQRLRTSNWEAILPGSEPDSFTVVSPVRVAGREPLGFVCLTFTEARALAQIRSGTWGQIGLLSALFILGTAMAVVLSRRFVNPIHAMVAGTTAIRDGRFDARIGVPRRDELGELAQSINAMAENLENIHQDLELRVEERTDELAEVNKKLREKISQLERFNRLSQGRESRIIEMKREVNEMARKAGRASPYKSAEERGANGIAATPTDAPAPTEQSSAGPGR